MRLSECGNVVEAVRLSGCCGLRLLRLLLVSSRQYPEVHIPSTRVKTSSPPFDTSSPSSKPY